MKSIYLAFCVFLIAMNYSCKKEQPSKQEDTGIAWQPYSPPKAENAVIYEVNIRQYSPEGTFDAFIKDIPKLQTLGVKILWVMPIQPISKKRRKATGDLFVEDIKDPEKREQYLGSYYAIADYTSIHPDYGTLEDFKRLVKTAHQNGMYVILDWVANHTGWDHPWIEEHPEYYHKNKDGEITDPLHPETGESEGWDDVAQLNYDNKDLFQVMENEMSYWVKKTDIDGFRADAADRVKLEFWKYAIPELEKIKPLFMLMEADNPKYLKAVFDMGYNWKLYHLMNAIAAGEKDVADLESLILNTQKTYQKEDILMNFTSNHDENSWAGTVYDRLGEEAVETFAALTYTLPGMPLLYNGQEYDSRRRLLFFKKDSIERKKQKMFEVYKKLGKLKNNDPALNGGQNKASYQRLKTSDNHNFIAFQRKKGGHQLIYIANLSDSVQVVKLPLTGSYKDYMNEAELEIEENKNFEFAPWEYKILLKSPNF